jgi:hypothetical protein
MISANATMKKIAQVLLTVTVVSTVLIAPAQAREGRLDRSFGEHGSVAIGNSIMAVGQGGSIALVGNKRVVVLTSKGQSNRRFGHGGSLPVPARVEGWSFEPASAALDSRGRLLLFGTAYPSRHGTVSIGPYSESVPIRRGAVLRFLPDGRPDLDFGQAGTVVSDFGVRAGEPLQGELGEPTTGIAGGTVDSLDRPLLAVGAAEWQSPCAAHSFIGWQPRALVRLTPSGRPDPEFGEGDGLSLEFPEFMGSPSVSLALTAGDQPLIGGALSGGCPQGASVIRLSEQGVPLSGYGPGGRQDFRHLKFVTFTPDGGAILERQQFSSEIVRRVTQQGQPDASFGRDGAVTMKLLPGHNYYRPVAAVDPKGRVLIIRSRSLPAVGPRAKRAFVVVDRLLSSGRSDRSFGHRGRITVQVPGARNVGSLQVSLDSEGRLLVLSELTKPNEYPTGAAVLTRFLLD